MGHSLPGGRTAIWALFVWWEVAMPTEYRKGKFLVTTPLPRDLLEALDEAALDNKHSRSAETREALRKHLKGRLTGEGAGQGISGRRARR